MTDGFRWEKVYEDGEFKGVENVTLDKFMELLKRAPLEDRLNNQIPINIRWVILVDISSQLRSLRKELQRTMALTEDNFEDEEIWNRFNRARWHFKKHLLDEFERHVDSLKSEVGKSRSGLHV